MAAPSPGGGSGASVGSIPAIVGALPTGSVVQDSTQKLVTEVLNWQREKGVTSIPNHHSDGACERSLGNRFKKMLLRRSKALGDRDSAKQLTPAEVALVNSVPGVPLSGCAVRTGTNIQQGPQAVADQGVQPAATTDSDLGEPMQKKRLSPGKAAFSAFREDLRANVQLQLRSETGATATHVDTEQRLGELWLYQSMAEKEAYYNKAGVSAAGLHKQQGKRTTGIAFGALAQNMGAQRRRISNLKRAISEAGSGNEVQAIIAALTKEQQIELLAALQKKHPEKDELSWKRLGRRLVDLLAASAHRKFVFPYQVLSHALRSIGFGCRRRVRESMQILVPRRIWKESRQEEILPHFMPTKADNGRLGYRQCAPEAFRAVLDENCTESSAPMSAKSRPITDKSKDVVFRKSLTDSGRQVFLNFCSSLGISLPTWYRNKKSDHPDVRGGKAKLDTCEDCTHWDNSIEPCIHDALKAIKSDLASMSSDYWKKWDDEIMPTLNAQAEKQISKRVTYEFVQAMARYVRSHKSWDRREAVLGSRKAAQLHQRETNALCTLTIKWGRFEDGHRVGILQVVEHYCWHFTCRDSQTGALRRELLQPAPGRRNILLDFAQSPTLPVGPKQSSRWWFAPSRFSVSCLGFYVWGDGLPPGGQYVMFLSRVMDHTPWYVVAALDHLNTYLPPMSSDCKEEALWSDIGLHFRCYRLWAYWLVHIALTRGHRTLCNFLPGGHGKTRLDGQFGRRSKWTTDIALKHMINDVEQFTRLLNARAAQAHVDNPTSPIVHFVHFEPPPKSTLYDKTLDGEAMRENCMSCHSTYAVSSILQKNGRVKLQDHKLTGQPPQQTCNPRLIAKNSGEQNYEASEDIAAGKPEADGWRRSFRKLEPEKEDNNLKKLSAQYAAVSSALRSLVPLSGRSKTKDHALSALELQQAQKKAADAAVRKAVKEKQKVESSSSSSESSGSDSSSSSTSSGSS